MLDSDCEEPDTRDTGGTPEPACLLYLGGSDPSAAAQLCYIWGDAVWGPTQHSTLTSPTRPLPTQTLGLL